jgi:diketogulonate reductase-like aldo/keto reductase
MKTLHGISLKHRVDIASVALRWAMQQESIGTISVGTSLNTRLDEPFKLQQDLRKAFTLHLGEDDLEELLNVSGAKPTNRNDEFDQIDFSDKKLWL